MNREALEKNILFLAINGSFPDFSSDGLSVEHFSDPINQIIFNAIRKIEAKGRSCRFADLGLVLPGDQNVACRLSELADQGATSLEPSFLVRSLINASDEDALCRRIASCLRSKASAGFGEFGVANKISDIFEKHGRGKIHEIDSRELLKNTIDDLLADEEFTTVMKTGIHKLDEIIYGLLPGKLYVIAARPGCGKTALAVNMALNAMMSQGQRSLYITIEMSATEIQQRILCAQLGINTKSMLMKNLTSEEMNLLKNYDESLLPACGVAIKSDTHGSWETTEDAIKRFVRYDHVSLVVIDYIQQFRTSNQKASMRENISIITSRCKQLAQDLNVPIIAVSQLNRNIEARGEDLPMLSDLKESGTIEQDADVVIMMTKRDDEKDVVWFNVAKNRHGEVGYFPVKSELQFSRFTNDPVESTWEKKKTKKYSGKKDENWGSAAEKSFKDN